MLRQGEPIDEASYTAIEKRYQAVSANTSSADSLEPPPNYSAFLLTPRSVEFYSGGHPGYINDRFLYVCADDTEGGARGAQDDAHSWKLIRLQA